MATNPPRDNPASGAPKGHLGPGAGDPGPGARWALSDTRAMPAQTPPTEWERSAPVVRWHSSLFGTAPSMPYRSGSSERLGVTLVEVEDLERGDINPTRETVERIASRLGIEFPAYGPSS